MNDTEHPHVESGDDRESPDPESAAIPEVDDLEARLREVDAAMDLLQNGDLDAAEVAIEALENRQRQEI